MSSLAVRDEVLQPSAVFDYPWPDSDPRFVKQPVRERTSEDVEVVHKCASSGELDMDAFTKNCRQMSDAERVFYYLSHQKHQFNPVGQVRSETTWLNRIQSMVASRRPITITYPQLCKQGNWAKQMGNLGAAAGEDCCFLFFAHMDRQVRTFYPPGLEFKLVCDASLYNSAFQNSQIEVLHYMKSTEARVEALGLSHLIEILDYVDLLNTHAAKEYMTHYREFHAMLWNDDGIGESLGVESETLYESVRASINTQRLGLSYEQQKAIFGSRSPDRQSHYGALIESMTTIAYREVLATRLACGKIDLLNRVWPNAVRVTCHKGAKNGVWHIGLRPYPEYYGSSKLLPYHGAPLVSTSKKGKLKLEIHPEVSLRGRQDLTRVESNGETYFYITPEAESI